MCAVQLEWPNISVSTLIKLITYTLSGYSHTIYRIDGTPTHEDVSLRYNLRYVRDTEGHSNSESHNASQSNSESHNASQSTSESHNASQSTSENHNAGQSSSSSLSDPKEMDKLLDVCEQAQNCTKDNHTYYEVQYITSKLMRFIL